MLPPAAGPPVGAVPAGPGLAVQLQPRARKLELIDAGSRRLIASAPAGVGPTHAVCAPRPGWCYVVDTRGEALLVYSLSPHRLEPTRRLYLPGGPYGLTIDNRRRRLWVTLRALDELVELPAHGRPHVLRRFDTARRPDSVAVDERTGRVSVMGTGRVETLDAG